MSRLFLPPKVARELLEERSQFSADIEKVTHSDKTCEEWDRELKRLDPLLRMRRAPEKPVLGLPLHPGCYHLIRDNPGAPCSVTPVLGPDGKFTEPPGHLLEQLKAMDLWDTRVERMHRRIKQAEEERQERYERSISEQRREELFERLDSVTRAQVSMDRSIPWTQNANGRRPKKKDS
jgi:hypothetical protein